MYSPELETARVPPRESDSSDSESLVKAPIPVITYVHYRGFRSETINEVEALRKRGLALSKELEQLMVKVMGGTITPAEEDQRRELFEKKISLQEKIVKVFEQETLWVLKDEFDLLCLQLNAAVALKDRDEALRVQAQKRDLQDKIEYLETQLSNHLNS